MRARVQAQAAHGQWIKDPLAPSKSIGLLFCGGMLGLESNGCKAHESFAVLCLGLFLRGLGYSSA